MNYFSSFSESFEKWKRIILPMSGLDRKAYPEVLENFSYSKYKVALVVGNSAYREAPLKNPVNDAEDIAGVLGKLGFDVELLKNTNRKELKAAIRVFHEKFHNGGVGLFYFAGHGVQVNGQNFLIPVDADIHNESEVDDAAINVGLILGNIYKAKNRLNIIILDACRNNPYERSFRSMSRGLAVIEAPSGTLIAYSTSPGMVAADGEGRNSPYTGELLNQMQATGIEIEKVFKQVRISVKRKTGDRQVPWESSSLTGEFYLRPPRPKSPLSYAERYKRSAIKVRNVLLVILIFFVLTKILCHGPVKHNSEKPSPKLPPTSPPFRPSKKILSISDVKSLLKNHDFYCNNHDRSSEYCNPVGKGFLNDYQLQILGIDSVVIDRASSLMWQKSGSESGMQYDSTGIYIEGLNRQLFAYFTDWRLPTLEEAMSLVEPEKKKTELHIDPKFNPKQQWIWTADCYNSRSAWSVNLANGYCSNPDLSSRNYVRAVRSWPNPD